MHQLIEGRISLLEAVARFQAVHRSSTAKLEKSLGVSASPTDPESMARAVIGWVHLELSDRPEHAEAVSGRLERELQRSLDRTGKLSLPSVN
ncbi:MAG TPA: hypothetical protein VIL46_02170 [Gemmataceae bacterium]